MSRWIPVKNFVSNPTSRTRVFATPPLLCHSSSSMPLAHRARRPRHVHVERARDFIKNVERARDFIKNKGTVECHGKLVQQTLVYCSDSTTPHSGPHLHLRICPYFLPYPSLFLSLSLSLSQTPLLPSGPLLAASQRHVAPHGLRKTRRGHAATYTSHKTVVTRMCQLLGIIGHTHKHTGGKAPQRV